MRAKNATLVGYHGYKNMGDDIFLFLTCFWLSSALNVKRCYVASKKGDKNKSLAGLELSPFHTPVERINRLLWLPIFVNAIRSDYLVFSAGSIFTIQPFLLIYITLKLLKLIRGSKLQIFAIGVSIGPFKKESDAHWCSKILQLMDRILLRDEQSASRVASMKGRIRATTSYDLALLWPDNLIHQKKENSGSIVGLSITERGFGNCSNGHSRNCESIAAAIAQALSENRITHLRIFNICADDKDGDLIIANHLRERLVQWKERIELVQYDGENLLTVLNSIATCSAIIASRMHAGIMATLSGVPIFQISYAEKISEFYAHSGLGKDYLTSDSELAEQAISEFLANALSGHLQTFANTQRQVLLHKGERLNNDLTSIAEICNKSAPS